VVTRCRDEKEHKFAQQDKHAHDGKQPGKQQRGQLPSLVRVRLVQLRVDRKIGGPEGSFAEETAEQVGHEKGDPEVAHQLGNTEEPAENGIPYQPGQAAAGSQQCDGTRVGLESIRHHRVHDPLHPTLRPFDA
jgi:hypothetical protein